MSRGQIALPFIILVSGIIIEVAIAGSFIAYFLSNTGFGDRLALRADTAAQAGIADAMQQISQNKSYLTTDSSTNYTLTVGGDSAAVVVSRASNAAANIYIYTITVTGTAGTRQKKYVATVAVNQTNGQLQLQSVLEVPVT